MAKSTDHYSSPNLACSHTNNRHMNTPHNPQREMMTMMIIDEKKANPAAATITQPTIPPSSASSPSHEFSFNISLQPHSKYSRPTAGTATKCNNKASPPPWIEGTDVDLSPADDIFFHGHLLPLHRPPAADISIEDLHLPFKHVHGQQQSPKLRTSNAETTETEGRRRSKHSTSSFSSLFRFKKWRKGSEVGQEEEEEKKKKANAGGFNVVARIWKKYAGVVEALLMFKKEKAKQELRRRPYSFSGNSDPVSRRRPAKKRGEFSVPVSMRTSPTNSGHLFAAPFMTTTTAGLPSSNESTMEELHSAIQAAIAHCKNSIEIKDVDRCKL